MPVDYNMKNKSSGHGGRSSKAFSSFSGVHAGKGGRGQSPGARTRRGQSVVKNGGHPGAKTIRGLSGLHITRAKKNIETYPLYRKSDKSNSAGTRRSQTVTKGGGHPSKAVVQAKPASVKVRPEC